MWFDRRPPVVPRQFTCSRENVEDCVASEQNVPNVTLCLLRNLSGAAEDGLSLCSNQTMACHLPEVSPQCLRTRTCVCLHEKAAV